MRSKFGKASLLGFLLTVLFFTALASAEQKKPRPPQQSIAAEKILSNQDIIDLVKAGFGDVVIIAKLKQSKCKFDLSTEEMLRLKAAGVSDNVISEMMNARSFEPRWPPKIHVTEDTSARVVGQGPGADPSDIRLETIKTLRDRKWPVTMDPKEADLVIGITRQMGKKSWGKDVKFTLTNRKGDVVHSESTRSVGGAVSNMIKYINKHREDEALFQ